MLPKGQSSLGNRVSTEEELYKWILEFKAGTGEAPSSLVSLVLGHLPSLHHCPRPFWVYRNPQETLQQNLVASCNKGCLLTAKPSSRSSASIYQRIKYSHRHYLGQYKCTGVFRKYDHRSSCRKSTVDTDA